MNSWRPCHACPVASPIHASLLLSCAHSSCHNFFHMTFLLLLSSPSLAMHFSCYHVCFSPAAIPAYRARWPAALVSDDTWFSSLPSLDFSSFRDLPRAERRTGDTVSPLLCYESPAPGAPFLGIVIDGTSCYPQPPLRGGTCVRRSCRCHMGTLLCRGEHIHTHTHTHTHTLPSVAEGC